MMSYHDDKIKDNVRYHPDAITLDQVGRKFSHAERNRELIEDYFAKRKQIFGSSTVVQPKVSKICKVKNCLFKRKPLGKTLCLEHYKIAESIVRFVDGRLCPKDGCKNKIYTGGKCNFHFLAGSNEQINDIDIEKVEEIADDAASFVAKLAEDHPLDTFYIGVSQNFDQRLMQHNAIGSRTKGSTENYFLVRGVKDKDLGDLEHEILEKSSKLIDSRRFKNLQPGGCYNPKNNRTGLVYLLRYENDFDHNTTEPHKDFSGSVYKYSNKQSKVPYPELSLPKIKEPISLQKALLMIGYEFHELNVSKIRNGRYKCDLCDSSFNENQHLKTHMLVHTTVTEKCNLCSFESKHHSSLRTHMKTHGITLPLKSLKLTSYVCEFCQEEFTNYTDLNSHRHKHKTATCEYCPEVMQKRSLKLHMRRFHPYEKLPECLKKIIKETDFRCVDCDQFFQTASNLREHFTSQKHRNNANLKTVSEE